jgi:AcrR family transcriptional regulator
MLKTRKTTARKALTAVARPLGRPRAFDPQKALDRALRVFWERGYEGASLAALTKAMRINRPSMYATFGNKEQLFRKALDRYAELAAVLGVGQPNEPTARATVEQMLVRAADNLSDSSHPQGCLLVQAALTCGAESSAVRRELCSRRAAGETALRERLERAKAERDLPAEADAGALASYITTVLQGMSVQAAGGASRQKLRGIASRAMQAWPK